MSLPMFDKALVILIILTSIAITDGLVLADPPPDPCDNFCRERRFFKHRDETDVMDCTMVKYRDCLRCKVGLCFRNADEDKLTNGECKEQTVTQEVANHTFASCDAMCPFPLQSGEAIREAAEGPTTYSDIQNWLELSANVRKCFVNGQVYKQWDDEKDKEGKKIEWK